MNEFLSIELINLFEKIVQDDPNSYFICIDGLRTLFFDKIYKKYPDRVFCVGIAEQNAMGIAAGIALSGKTVYVVGLPVYEVCRAYEQLKLDICYNNANVRVIGYMTGLSLFSGGYSHWNTEDIALLRSLPNIDIVSPSSIDELNYFVDYYSTKKGPVYFRIDAIRTHHYKNFEKIIFNKPLMLKKGRKVAILATGASVSNSAIMLANLEKQGIDAALYSIHTIKPFNETEILKIAKKYKTLITVEEHSEGGLYSILSEIYVKNRLKNKVIPYKVNTDNVVITGSYDYALNSILNISDIDIAKKVGVPFLYKIKLLTRRVKYGNHNKKFIYRFLGVPYLKKVVNDNETKYLAFGFIPCLKSKVKRKSYE